MSRHPKRPSPPATTAPTTSTADDPDYSALSASSLCQPSPEASCGACCGMYNVTHLSRRHVGATLRARTSQFEAACDPHDPVSLMRYRQQREVEEVRGVFSDTLRACPFLGYIEPTTRRGRVGCLLHPTRHDGYDARDCGAYDSAATCEGFQCASRDALDPSEEALLIAACADDAYLYGLMVCDLLLLRELLRWVGEHTATPLRDLIRYAPFVRTCRAFFRLKADWPWRDPEVLMPGMFVPSAAELRAPLDMSAIDYDTLGCAPSRFDLILRQLASAFDDEDDLREAEALIWARLYATIDAARDASP